MVRSTKKQGRADASARWRIRLVGGPSAPRAGGPDPCGPACSLRLPAVAGFYLAVLLLVAAGATARRADKWTVYRDAKLIDNPANDGDSFHVRCGRAHYIFRLYFADCPETDLSFSDRVREQAEYFGVTDEEAVELGKRAAEFSQTFLKNGFTVYTKKEDARGRSDKPRYFAIIEAGGRDLSTALIEGGLARIYGCETELPDGRSGRKFWGDLRLAERRARKAEEGGWKSAGKGIAAVPELEARTLRLARSVTVYDPEETWRRLGTLRAGTEVRVLKAASSFMALVEFGAGDARRQGLCRTTELGAEQ